MSSHCTESKIFLSTGKNKCEEDNESIRLVYLVRHLSSMVTIRASANAADVWLERKFCYDYAKPKSKEKARTTPVRYAPI